MTTKRKIRRPYDASKKSSIDFPDKTMTKQSFADECDINNIMAKFQRTGLIEHVANVRAQYGDFTNVTDYQLSLNHVIAAQEAFEALPAKVRERFNNDPAHLMTFLDDPENRDEAVKLGLVNPAPPKEEKKSTGAPPQTRDATPPEGEAPA